MSKIVVLSNAHCKEDPGASGFGFTEYAYSCQVNEVIKTKLVGAGIDCRIVDGGKGNASATLKQKAELINAINPVCAVENHLNAAANATASYGSETIHWQGSSAGKALAESVSRQFKYLPFKEKGATGRSDLYLLRKTKCPAIITEPLFLSHELESKYLSYKRGIEVLGQLIAEGITSWVNSR